MGDANARRQALPEAAARRAKAGGSRLPAHVREARVSLAALPTGLIVLGTRHAAKIYPTAVCI